MAHEGTRNMNFQSLTRLSTAVGGLTLALTAGAGVAAAAPDLGPIINTTCSYNQVISALNAENPGAAADLNTSPAAQSMLRNFLRAGPEKRQEIATWIEGMPEAQQYVGTIVSVAGSCNNY